MTNISSYIFVVQQQQKQIDQIVMQDISALRCMQLIQKIIIQQGDMYFEVLFNEQGVLLLHPLPNVYPCRIQVISMDKSQLGETRYRTSLTQIGLHEHVYQIIFTTSLQNEFFIKEIFISS